MRRLRVASVALLVVASTGLLFGSTGFGSVAADRGVSVAVAGDDSALVGYDTHDQTVTGDERVALVTVQNRLSSSASVTEVTVEPPNAESAVRITDVQTPAAIPPGASGTIDAAVDCGSGASETLTVSVTVEADGVTAAISGDAATRSFEVTCADLESQDAGDVRFAGEGNVHFDEWRQERLNVTYWTDAGDGFAAHELSGVDASKHLKAAIDGGETSGFVAVYVEAADRTYFNPTFVADADDLVVEGKQAPGDR